MMPPLLLKMFPLAAFEIPTNCISLSLFVLNVLGWCKKLLLLKDSLSFGLHYCHNFAHIQKLGGSFISEGFLVTCLILAELLSLRVTQTLTRSCGRKCALMVTLIIAFFSHLVALTNNKLWVFFVARFIFALTHQTKRLCHDLLLGKETNMKIRGRLSMNLSILYGSGFVLGPIIGGYLLRESPQCMEAGATLLVLICIILLVAVDSDESEVAYQQVTPNTSLMRRIRGKVVGNFQLLKNADLKLNWDLILLKFLFIASITEFFAQFKHILARNCGPLTIIANGCIVAYMNILIFFSSWYIGDRRIHSKYLMEWPFFMIALLSLLLCYAPSYKFFVLLLVPFVLLKALSMNLLRDLISERQNEALEQIQPLAAIAASLITPLLFGIVCDSVGTVAVIPFTCAPLLVCWLVIRLHTRKFKFEGMEEGGHCSYERHSKVE